MRSAVKWSELLKPVTDIVQALCAIGLLALGVFGYVYTVLPLYSKAVLEEETARLTLDNDKLKQDNDKLKQANVGLQQQEAQEEKNLAAYRTTVIPYVADQFLNKVRSKADSYKCSPTVFDRGFPDRPIPAPATGASVIEANLKNQEFNLLPDAEKATLTDTINKFVAGYPQGGLSSELQIIHAAHFTGPLAAMPMPWSDPFKFCEGERVNSERAFQLFGRALTALQTQLIPNRHETIEFALCHDLGILSKCPVRSP